MNSEENNNLEILEIDEAIAEGETELQNGSKGILARKLKEKLDKKYYGEN